MSGTIVTVTLNPAVDQTIVVDRLTLGAVHRARESRSNAGGKGVNVAGCLADWGEPVVATGILGRDNAALFEAFFAEKGIEDRFVRVAGATRTNVKIADLERSDTTDINLPGLGVDAAALAAAKAALAGLVGAGTLVVLAGSLPDTLPADTLADMVDDLTGRGARVLLDTSGAPLVRALATDRRTLPFCIKPNAAELAEWAGRPLVGEADLVEAARGLVARGIGLVAVSRGAEGALFVDAEGALSARLPPVEPLSTVGAGDAMVAGIAAGLSAGAGLGGVARLGVAFATAKLARVGPHLPSIAVVKDLAAQVSIAPAAQPRNETA